MAVLKRVPRVAIAVFLVALLNGLAWSLLTPPFQVPDEPSHFAYAQQLAETGHRAGRPGRPESSSEQTEAMTAMGTFGIIGRPLVRPPATHAASDRANQAISRAANDAPRDNGGGLSTASSQPALYYALEAVPYTAFTWASLPERLGAMRVLSALMFAVSAALCGLLAAELLPGRRWVPVVAGLAIALSPYTAFVASGVNPDALLLLMGTALLFVVVRALRRGLTRARAIALGLLVGLGVLTKLTFLAFLPGAVLALAVLLWRDRREVGNTVAVAALAVVAGVAPLVVYAAYAAISGGGLKTVGGGGTAPLPADQIKPFNAREFASYIWQLYLPRFHFQVDQLGFSAPYEIWIKGFAGRFGWLDFQVPEWIVRIARDVIFVGLALIAVALVRLRQGVRRHWVELVVLGSFAAGLAFAIAKKGYDYHRETGLIFEQARYLFPIAGLYAAAVALAVSALGRKAAPVLAVLAVALFAVHDAVGVMTTMARYYS
jgi:4-amino-4-deoxy-L-arabinose transferase-like glycosyltransferase